MTDDTIEAAVEDYLQCLRDRGWRVYPENPGRIEHKGFELYIIVADLYKRTPAYIRNEIALETGEPGFEKDVWARPCYWSSK